MPNLTLENLSVLRAFAVKMTFCSEVTDAVRTNFALGHPTFVLSPALASGASVVSFVVN